MNEFAALRAKDFKLDFVYPTEEQRKELQMLLRHDRATAQSVGGGTARARRDGCRDRSRRDRSTGSLTGTPCSVARAVPRELRDARRRRDPATDQPDHVYLWSWGSPAIRTSRSREAILVFFLSLPSRNIDALPALAGRADYPETYSVVAAERAFHVRLLDGALVQMDYRFIRRNLQYHRLTLVPSPAPRRFPRQP